MAARPYPHLMKQVVQWALERRHAEQGGDIGRRARKRGSRCGQTEGSSAAVASGSGIALQSEAVRWEREEEWRSTVKRDVPSFGSNSSQRFFHKS
jgi:hypothetical protein